ncbi:uncharacterized protein LOC119071724 isoform X1 [Bradysia coprophila]|uniref:uncharacterized protein LOC119071724 isoform X1 n=1 Tax=Bradysia coprophila TaxID=38358 RepID=UPI00187DB682|nr:uncharacterized protein LOC119071724 isoform X1 [Bradysia coprophila]
MKAEPLPTECCECNYSTTNGSNGRLDSDEVAMRPNTLNVTRNDRNVESKKFIREALYAWRAKARCNVVPAERLYDLFRELNFNPTEKQINEMLQTAKLFARRSNNLDASKKHMNGLTFGEFCVLATDLKRFRTYHASQGHDQKSSSSLSSSSSSSTPASSTSQKASTTAATDTNSDSNSDGQSHSKTDPIDKTYKQPFSTIDINAPEVFLGGSCNPTTWRKDVAIPALDELGISFYNPQVSDWTPDLIELEHRAKEKARVLFFVMDSETRASAGAIEAAHIAGQNSRHLVLVLHPYKPEQCILNEPISSQEYIDLKRNQELLKELVIRRGIPVLDSIPSGLQRTRAILTGDLGRSPPSNVSSRLKLVRRAFDRVADKSLHNKITLAQCQCALSYLGYPQNLISTNCLTEIIDIHRENGRTQEVRSISSIHDCSITFDEFCMITSYLAILQQEIHESGCISPIKGTNLPPPPIFLTNTPELMHNTPNDHLTVTYNTTYSKQIFRTSSCKSVPEDRFNRTDLYRNRDSGTSSPQELKNIVAKVSQLEKKTKISLNVEYFASEQEEESDSNDSVFSSGSSIDSNHIEHNRPNMIEIKDLYLGGSCMLRTTWRKDFVIPMLNQMGISYHLPMLHESIFNGDSTHQLPGPVKVNGETELAYCGEVCSSTDFALPSMFNPAILDASRVLLFVITNETRSLAPMTLAAHYIGLGYNVVLCVQMLPEFCVLGNDRLTPAAIKDYNRGRSYLIDLAKRQGVPVFSDLKQTIDCAIEKVKSSNSRNSI